MTCISWIRLRIFTQDGENRYFSRKTEFCKVNFNKELKLTSQIKNSSRFVCWSFTESTKLLRNVLEHTPEIVTEWIKSDITHVNCHKSGHRILYLSPVFTNSYWSYLRLLEKF